MSRKQKKMLIRIIISAVMMVGLYFVPVKGYAKFLMYLVPYFVIGYDILKKSVKGILKGQVFDENFLMAAATVGALAIGLVRTGDYAEAVAVMLFYQIGELFQDYAVGKSRRNISELMDIRPDYANIENNGVTQKVDPDEILTGSIIAVYPGEKVPIDGVVIDGTSTVNTSALTGESIPKDITVGDEVISGCINMSGVLKIRTTKEFGESTVSKILELVENASSRKSKSEKFISKFARIYTPAVCYSAVALAVLPPLGRMLIMGLSPEWGDWIYRALTFLVISCPCALVISIPMSFFGGIGGASKEGILIKGSNYIEMLAKTKCVVFDKTGTLTQGVFSVSGIHHNEMENEKLLEYAALAESGSSHPISKSLKRAYGKEIDTRRVSDIKEISGKGIIATVDDTKVIIGNDKLMKHFGIKHIECHCSGTIIHIALNGKYAGHIVISDIIKENSKSAITELKKLGAKKTVMLTGDLQNSAENVANVLGIDEFYSGLLPGDKVDKLEEIMKREKTNSAFVGDGINDAPVLSMADIGIAMGAMGSDAAIEAADVVLMDDDPMKIAKAVKISRKCMSIVYQNIVFAIGIKLICLLLGAFGIANMWLAIFADVGVMIIAVLNAVRALFVKKI